MVSSINSKRTLKGDEINGLIKLRTQYAAHSSILNNNITFSIMKIPLTNHHELLEFSYKSDYLPQPLQSDFVSPALVAGN